MEHAQVYESIENRGKREKVNHVGAPAVFALERECQYLRRAFGTFGPYLVGSCLARADWRDIDVRYVLEDASFAALFPDADEHWEFDPRWITLTTSISLHLSRATGLPVDFQFQPQRWSQKKYAEQRREPLGLIYVSPG